MAPVTQVLIEQQFRAIGRIVFLLLPMIAGCAYSEPIPLQAGSVQENLLHGSKVVVTHFRATPFNLPRQLLAPNGAYSSSGCGGSGKGCLVAAVVVLPFMALGVNSEQDRVRIFADGLLLRDPAAILQDRFSSALKHDLQLAAMRVIPHTVETEYTSLLADHGLVFLFRTTEWRLEAIEEEYAKLTRSSTWGEGNVDTVKLYFLYKVDVELVSEPIRETLWRDSCSFDSRKNQNLVLSFGEFRAGDGRELKLVGAQAAEYCGSQLATKLLNELPAPSHPHQ